MAYRNHQTSRKNWKPVCLLIHPWQNLLIASDGRRRSRRQFTAEYYVKACWVIREYTYFSIHFLNIIGITILVLKPNHLSLSGTRYLLCSFSISPVFKFRFLKYLKSRTPTLKGQIFGFCAFSHSHMIRCLFYKALSEHFHTLLRSHS